MKSIFGAFARDGRVVPEKIVNGLYAAIPASRLRMSQFSPLLLASFYEGPLSSAEAKESCSCAHNGNSHVVAAGSIYNRAERAKALGLSQSEGESLADSELLSRLYDALGEDAVSELYGDWSFAHYDSRKQKLFLARDHYGSTSLYYYLDSDIFVFSSSRKLLLALELSPLVMDELYLAQVMISWPAYHGDRTVHNNIKRLPPAHCITVTPDNVSISEYWRPERQTQIRLPGRKDYVAAFLEIFDEAVRCRVKSAQHIAVSMSGGLDSSSVAVTAAKILAAEGGSLAAFTSVPLSATGSYLVNEFGDEYPYAKAAAGFAGNINLCKVPSAGMTPVAAIRQVLAVTLEPSHAAGNYYWLVELRKAVRASGAELLLNGQAGNAGISWTGDMFSQPLAFQLAQLGGAGYLRAHLKRALPLWAAKKLLSARIDPKTWCRASAINPDFASRLHLLELKMDAPDSYPSQSTLGLRSFLKPGRALIGCLQAELAAAFGVPLTDPTADPRVLEFTLAIPDRIFMDPATGVNRWLIREAMKGRLPDEVRLNRKLGRQSADLVPRLRASAQEVEAVLAELASGPAAAYVDVLYMRQVWQLIQLQDTPEAFRKAGSVLTRGIMAGLFVNQFYGYNQ